MPRRAAPVGQPRTKIDLGEWALYCLVIGILAAYLAARTLSPGAEYLEVFRVAGTIAFLDYAAALAKDAIWMERGAWSAAIKSMADGMVYAFLTAGVFGWSWRQ